MNSIVKIIVLLFGIINLNAQTNPAINNWLINSTNIKGKHYVKGNSTPIVDNVLANVQKVQYSSTSVYITTNGIPAFTTGPFLDGNPSLATSQNAIFKFPLNPVKNNGTPTNTTNGNIGIFINGVALFDYRDGVSWQNSTNSLKGGPLQGQGDAVWNRDAIVGERLGFDCAKAHPAMGNYHHHQNPSAFSLDLKVISNVCDLYAADGLYAIDSTKHSPLIGFTYDGFPIYGAYAFKNVDGTGGVVRMKSSYTLRSITTRTQYTNGVNVTAGPAVNTTYPLGYFREDYQYNTTSANSPDYLDDHNGRFCVTPEYPNGIYCYYATVDENWNSAYPYVVGPTFYGVKTAVKVTSITESVTEYVKTTSNLIVSKNSINLQASASSTGNFDITSNIDWTAVSSQTWLKLNKTSGNGNTNIIITADENTSTSTRNATISISGNGVNSQVINVIQEATAIGLVLNVSLDVIKLTEKASNSTIVTVTSNTSWTATSDQQWITLDKYSGSGNADVKIIVEENTLTNSRSGKITISGVGVASKIINVSQSGIESMISIAQDKITILAMDDGTKFIDLNSNTSWTATKNSSWISLSKENGSGNAKIMLTATENKDTTVRNATITIFANQLPSINVNITQLGAKISSVVSEANFGSINVYPNPTSELVAVQLNGISQENVELELYDANGTFIQSTLIYQGTTIAYFDTRTLYSGEYLLKLKSGNYSTIRKVMIIK